jgi:hypothetical protein
MSTQTELQELAVDLSQINHCGQAEQLRKAVERLVLILEAAVGPVADPVAEPVAEPVVVSNA